MLDDAKIKELRALCEKATPGPWNTPDNPESVVDVWVDRDMDDAVAAQWEHWHAIAPEVRGRDAAFIAAARNAMPEMLDELERLNATVDRKDEQMAELQEELERCARPPDPNGGDTSCGHTKADHDEHGACTAGVSADEGWWRCPCERFVRRAVEAAKSRESV